MDVDGLALANERKEGCWCNQQNGNIHGLARGGSVDCRHWKKKDMWRPADGRNGPAERHSSKQPHAWQNLVIVKFGIWWRTPFTCKLCICFHQRRCAISLIGLENYTGYHGFSTGYHYLNMLFPSVPKQCPGGLDTTGQMTCQARPIYYACRLYCISYVICVYIYIIYNVCLYYIVLCYIILYYIILY